MDKLQERDPEGGPEKDGEMNFEDCAASLIGLHSMWTTICNSHLEL